VFWKNRWESNKPTYTYTRGTEDERRERERERESKDERENVLCVCEKPKEIKKKQVLKKKKKKKKIDREREWGARFMSRLCLGNVATMLRGEVYDQLSFFKFYVTNIPSSFSVPSSPPLSGFIVT